MRSFALLIALVLAGCSGAPSSPPVETASTTTTASTPGAQAILDLVGSSPVNWDGHTKEGVWVCSDASGTGQCPAGSQVMPDGQFARLVAFRGNLTAIDVNVTWQADPSQPALVFAAYTNTTQGFLQVGLVEGASPLHLRVAGTDLGVIQPDDVVLFMAWPQGKTPTSPSVFVDLTQQAFHVEGSLATRIQAAAPA